MAFRAVTFQCKDGTMEENQARLFVKHCYPSLYAATWELHPNQKWSRLIYFYLTHSRTNKLTLATAIGLCWLNWHRLSEWRYHRINAIIPPLPRKIGMMINTERRQLTQWSQTEPQINWEQKHHKENNNNCYCTAQILQTSAKASSNELIHLIVGLPFFLLPPTFPSTIARIVSPPNIAMQHKGYCNRRLS